MTITNVHAPFKKKRVRISGLAAWLISEIKRLMRERVPRIKRIAISTKHQTKWIHYKKIKNQVNHSVIAWIKDYYHSYYESNIGKSKAMHLEWNQLGIIFIKKEKQNSGSKVFIDGKDINDNHKIRTAFKSYLRKLVPL